MATYYPLIVNTGTPQIQELPSGNDLNLSQSNISNVASITVTSSNTAIANGSGNGVGNIGSSSTYFNTVFAKSTSAQYADLAECYAGDAEYAPGTVVKFGGSYEVTLADQDHDSAIAGVVTTNPAYKMNTGITADHVVTIALCGRVPCQVKGPVKKGAMLVSAGQGHARAETNPAPGTIIGKAIEDFNGDTGTIEVAVGRL